MYHVFIMLLVSSQIRQHVANGLPPLRGFFEAVLPIEMGAATRYTLWRDNASIIKISLWKN